MQKKKPVSGKILQIIKRRIFAKRHRKLLAEAPILTTQRNFKCIHGVHPSQETPPKPWSPIHTPPQSRGETVKTRIFQKFGLGSAWALGNISKKEGLNGGVSLRGTPPPPPAEKPRILPGYPVLSGRSFGKGNQKTGEGLGGGAPTSPQS